LEEVQEQEGAWAKEALKLEARIEETHAPKKLETLLVNLQLKEWIYEWLERLIKEEKA
jgi:hypothetical protein